MNYATNLTDNQWNFVQKHLSNASHKRKHCLRSVFIAILCLLKTGCQWYMLPSDFPAWNAVYYYFACWKRDGTLEYLMRELHKTIRNQAGRDREPSLAIIDSRSVKTSHHVDKVQGIDGSKRIKCRKQHIAVYVMGFAVGLAAHEANVFDACGAPLVLEDMDGRSELLRTILADGGYRREAMNIAIESRGKSAIVSLAER